MPRFDPTHRAAELRALVDQLRSPARADHPLRGRVRFVAGTYTLSHLGVTASATVGAADAVRAWADAATRRATALEAAARLWTLAADGWAALDERMEKWNSR